MVPTPKPHTSASPSLLVLCDLTCDWKLDGVAQGRIDGGASAKVKVELGQHLVVVVSASNARDRIERMVEVKGVGQTLVNLKLEPIRDARLQSEQNARQQQLTPTTPQETTPQTGQPASPQSDASVWTDPATGLMWTRHDNNADANWNEAGSYCQNLRLDGYSDWQLPTVQDLQGILDLSQSSQCGTETCHIKGNIQLTTKWVWTSTPGGEAGHAMYFRFSEGQYLSYPYTDRQLDRVLCVRPGTGGQSAQVQPQTQQRSAPQSDASVWVDPGTNLMWTRHDNNADANWNEAGGYCQNLRLDGYSDWQLPTVQDLQGILDLSQSSQCGTETCHIKGNIQLTSKWVWTSTPGGEAGHAMYFRFSEGQYLSYPYSDRQLDRVLCVRPADSVAAQSVPTGAVWTDPATGLLWQRSDSGDNNDLTWQQAVNYCRGNSSGGYSDWRLPTVDELTGIYDTSQSVNYQCCGGTSSGVMHVKGGIQMSGEEWTSSESDDGKGAYRIWLSDSSHSVWTKTESYDGRGICVRGAR